MIATLIGLPLLMASCASGPTAEQLRAADYGSYASPEDCQKIAESAFDTVLKDPRSAQWKHNSCTTGYWTSVPIMGLPVAFGYFQTGMVNSKNSFGAYVGFAPYQVLIKNGQVIRKCIHDRNNLCVPM